MSDKTRALLIFARTRTLIPGTVKKRLARTIGNKFALHCYNLLLNKSVTSSAKFTAQRFLYFYPQIIETLPGADYHLASHFTLRCQKPEIDLGQKMAAALTETLQQDNCKLAVLIGSDIPFLETDIIEQAFSKLATADIVLGPALDGGYYLIGLQRRELAQTKIFQDIPWGTDQVFATTVARARATVVATLPSLFDVDTLADLKKWRQKEKDSAIAVKLCKVLART